MTEHPRPEDRESTHAYEKALAAKDAEIQMLRDRITRDRQQHPGRPSSDFPGCVE